MYLSLTTIITFARHFGNYCRMRDTRPLPQRMLKKRSPCCRPQPRILRFAIGRCPAEALLISRLEPSDKTPRTRNCCAARGERCAPLGRTARLTIIICCLLETYWVNPFPGASFGINHFFSYIAQAMVAAFDQSSLDSLLQLLKSAGDNTAMPGITAWWNAIYDPCQVSMGCVESSLQSCPQCASQSQPCFHAV
jgi:hypothetical protein